MKTARIIILHGISDHIMAPNYAIKFEQAIIKKLKARNIISNNASQLDIDKIITFNSVNYSAIGSSEETKVLDSYEQEKKYKYSIFNKLLDFIIYNQIRKQLITSVSDVLVYESEFWKEQIRSLLLVEINKYVQSTDPVTVIGHSLGSVVSFDTLYYNSRHNALWQSVDFKVTNFFTLGSPIALFSLELDTLSGEQKPRYIPMDSMPSNLDPRNTNTDLDIIRPNGLWINFFDPQDIIGYPLEVLFKDKFRVQDKLVKNGILPISAHTGYWKNSDILNSIIDKLIFDWKNN